MKINISKITIQITNLNLKNIKIFRIQIDQIISFRQFYLRKIMLKSAINIQELQIKVKWARIIKI